jgi:hypothetical protein
MKCKHSLCFILGILFHSSKLCLIVHLKVHDLLRNFLLQDLIVDPGPLGHPDLSFREWLIESGVLARRETLLPG